MNRNFVPVFRAFLVPFIVGAVLSAASSSQAAPQEAEGRVKKVLPHLLDQQGRHTASASLFDRDAYQANLRKNPEKISGIRYDVHWKVRQAEGRSITIRVELRGVFEGKVPREKTLERTVDGRASVSDWTGLELTGDAYTQFGKITAWRATLWSGDTMLDEYKSFLW